jgi:DNA-binding NtrC family response regulator
MATILIVDDDVDMCEAYTVVLEARGHEIIKAHSGAEARDVLEGTTPDAAILDVMMETDTAGFELARYIHDKNPKLPMIMVTGVHEATGAPFRFQPDESWLPVIKIMDKPIKPATLAEELEALLQSVAN